MGFRLTSKLDLGTLNTVGDWSWINMRRNDYPTKLCGRGQRDLNKPS